MTASKPKFRFFLKRLSFIPLKIHLGALIVDLGCFPFGSKSYHLLPVGRSRPFTLFGFGPPSLTCPYPRKIKGPGLGRARRTTLYLNTFRGKPAISEFDKHFTSNHNSLQIFTTITYSIFQFLVENLQSDHD